MRDFLILLGIIVGVAAVVAGLIWIIRWRFNVGRSLNMVFSMEILIPEI